MTATTPPVEQVDTAAADKWLSRSFRSTTTLAQAFARHRIATAQASDAEIARLEKEGEALRARIARRQCSCAEIAGEDPDCIKHGRGTMWGKENPDVCDMLDKLAAAEAESARLREAAEFARSVLSKKAAELLVLWDDEEGDDPDILDALAKLEQALALGSKQEVVDRGPR